MPFTSEPQRENLRSLDDVGTLRALANPVRQRILNHLMAFGAQTASQCAGVAGATASNCSYHLRELERYGLVERAPAETDGRERRWRSIATGRTEHAAASADPAIRTAEQALAHIDLEFNNQLAVEALAGRDAQAAEWREASTLSSYALRLTPAELRGLLERLDILIRPYIGLTREAPEGADVVHLRLDAFRHPDAR